MRTPGTTVALFTSKLGQDDKAVADYSKAIELDPSNVYAWHNRGMIHATLGQVDEAVADYTKAIELDPKYVKALD